MKTRAVLYERIRDMWRKAVAPFFAVVILGAALSLTPQSAGAATQEAVDEALAAGIAWSVSQQEDNGGWSATTYENTRRDIGTTALAVTALGHYAEHLGVDPLGVDPLGDDYQYRDNILAGLDFIFGHADTRYDATNNRVWFGGAAIAASDNYVAGPVLMAIVMTDAPDRVVEGGVLDGMTYAEVVQGMINYLDHTQCKTDTGGVGAWNYTGLSTSGDMSITGFVTLGLGYAKDRFEGILFPEDRNEKTMLDYLDEGIQYMQWTDDPDDPRYGGVGYYSPDYSTWMNIYKTGHLLYIMDLVGDDADDTPRVQVSLDFLRRHWNAPNSGTSGYQAIINEYIDVGWRGGPDDPPDPLPSYIATVTTMKALVELGLVELDGVYDVAGDPENTSDIDWFDDFSDVIVANQHEDGYWEQGGYPAHYLSTLDTQFALLTLLRAAPEDPVIDPELENRVKRPPPPPAPDFPVAGTVQLDVRGTGATFEKARRLNIGHGGAVRTGTVELPVGGFDFTIRLPGGKSCVIMKMTPPAGSLDPANPNGFLDAGGNIKAGLNWFKIQSGAWRGLATVPISLKPDGGPYTEIWVELCDGGPEDEGIAGDGKIVDPGAPGVGAVADAPPVAPGGGSSSGCFINTVSP